jgi:hypothetical protein
MLNKKLGRCTAEDTKARFGWPTDQWTSGAIATQTLATAMAAVTRIKASGWQRGGTEPGEAAGGGGKGDVVVSRGGR